MIKSRQREGDILLKFNRSVSSSSEQNFWPSECFIYIYFNVFKKLVRRMDQSKKLFGTNMSIYYVYLSIESHFVGVHGPYEY